MAGRSGDPACRCVPAHARSTSRCLLTHACRLPLNMCRALFKSSTRCCCRLKCRQQQQQVPPPHQPPHPAAAAQPAPPPLLAEPRPQHKKSDSPLVEIQHEYLLVMLAASCRCAVLALDHNKLMPTIAALQPTAMPQSFFQTNSILRPFMLCTVQYPFKSNPESTCLTAPNGHEGATRTWSTR